MFKIFDVFKKKISQIITTASKQQGKAIIELKNIRKTFGKKLVLDGVNITLNQGETLAVIGPSGCGKSTILRIILGLIKPDSGSVIVNDKELSQLDKDGLVDLRKHIGMVFQSSALFDSLTVGENVAFGLREHTYLTDEKIKAIVSDKLALVGLKGSESQMPSELSGGMQKRVSLARALATDPEIILYDEPTTGLDPITSTSIEDLVNSIHKSLGTSAIVVTHQMSTVYRIANRIIMLHNGKVLDAGSPEKAKASQDPIIRSFINGIPS